MKHRHAWSALLLVLSMAVVGLSAAEEPSHEQLRANVEKLVQAAQKRTTLWPWQGPVPEVASVAAYGKAIAPMLVNLLAADPDALDESSPEVDWHVQQQIALALCKIYGVTEEAGHVYMNRASREKNAEVKRFWVQKVNQQ